MGRRATGIALTDELVLTVRHALHADRTPDSESQLALEGPVVAVAIVVALHSHHHNHIGWSFSQPRFVR